MAMLTNCWLATLTSTPISSSSWPGGNDSLDCDGLRESLLLKALITRTSGWVSMM
ncbi:hypothetical protein D3C79_694520 [compost metagenome]